MGSKQWQLRNGLGVQLRKLVQPGDTVVDLFSGSGAVAWFAATELSARVVAVDLQSFAAVLSASVIERTSGLDARELIDQWIEPARTFSRSENPSASTHLTTSDVYAARELAGQSSDGFVRSYGGHFFSPEQAALLGLLRSSLPDDPLAEKACLAALVVAASRCSASPGHTAQPFQPTERALPHIESAWRRDLLGEAASALRKIAPLRASHEGRAIQGSAVSAVENLRGHEIVFLDPPYSSAQYSRFYHVLEAVAIGGFSEVHGAGRAPSLSERAQSEFSLLSTATHQFDRLIERLAAKGCRLVVTFPQETASNGLSGDHIVEIARQWYRVDVHSSSATFSTLGGNGAARSARHKKSELVITMLPR